MNTANGRNPEYDYCVHCGERIYMNTTGRRWLHWMTVESHCLRSTVATPDGSK